MHEPIDVDSIGRLPKLPTNKLYAYRMTDGSLVTVWADNHLEAEELIDTCLSWRDTLKRDGWAWTSGSITHVPEARKEEW